MPRFLCRICKKKAKRETSRRRSKHEKFHSHTKCDGDTNLLYCCYVFACTVSLCVCVCFDKRTLGGPRQTTNGLLRHFVLSSSARLRLGRLLLLFLHRQQVSTSTGVCHGNGFSIRPACCFKLKIYTHTHWQR